LSHLRRALALLLLLGVLLGRGGDARADDCPARLHWIDARLARTAHRARVWTWGWGLGLGAATAANLAVVPFVERGDRVDWYVGAATSFVGLVPLVLLPLDVMDDSDALHARIAALAPGEDGCALLGEAERTLAHDADNQAEGRAWWMHAANVALNGGAGLLLGLGYDHWGSGVLTAVVGMGIGEAMIFTQPVESADDLRRYRAGDLTWRMTPLGGPRGLGLTMSASF